MPEIAVEAMTPLRGGLAHVPTVGPSSAARATQDDASSGPAMQLGTPKRMFAVTVALSEPAESEPIAWAETVASMLRLTFRNTSVDVIDTWEASK